MKFKTAISQTKDGKHLIQGKDITELIANHSYSEVVFLLLAGKLPDQNQKSLLESMLVAATENGIEAPSLYVPRVAAASGNNFQTALAAGVLAIGEQHGGAGEKAAEMLASAKTAEEILAKHKIIPGFGHKIYKDRDLRAEALYQKAKQLGFSCRYFNLAKEVEKQLSDKKGRLLPLNIDGALACCALELGLNPKTGKALFVIARVVGMAAHILEEYEQANSYYRLEKEDIAD